MSVQTVLTAIKIAGAAVTLGSIVTGLTKTPKDDEIFRQLGLIFSIVTPGDAPGTFKPPFTKLR